MKKLSIAAAALMAAILVPAVALAQTVDQPIDVDQLLALIVQQKWFVLVGATIMLAAYAVKHSTAWCPLNLSDKARALLATLLSGLATAVGAAAGWVSLGNSLFAFLLSGIPTILLFIQELLSESKAAKAAALKAVPPALLAIAMLSGCSATCPVIHAADELCPYVMVELEAGVQEPLECARLRAMAAQHRATRLAAESDGGVQ